jgi:RimJ/RimL family protein N-acetyltransferase
VVARLRPGVSIERANDRLKALGAELKAAKVLRIDSAVHVRNTQAARFYARAGFRPLHEERIALLL